MKYISPILHPPSQSLIGLIYRQIKRDFGVVADPFLLHSPVPELLAGIWSATRETAIAPGQVSWPVKEAVIAAVSRINACSYCVEVHTALADLHASQPLTQLIKQGRTEEIADAALHAIITWAEATRSCGSDALLHPPFSAQEAPEIIGVTVTYHYTNRMVHVFLSESLLPSFLRKGWIGNVAWSLVRQKLVRSRDQANSAGASLHFLPEADLPAEMSWAMPAPTISKAFAGWAALVQQVGQELLSSQVRTLVMNVLQEWKGEQPPLSRAWVNQAVSGLTEIDQASGKLALLTALSPYQIDEQIIQAFRMYYATDAQLVGVVAWASFAAACRIASWLHAPTLNKEVEQV